MTDRKQDTYYQSGFCNWKDFSNNLEKHQFSDLHKEAVLKLKCSVSTPVSALLDSSIKKSRKIANKQLCIVITALKFLSRQNLALRGGSRPGKEVSE